MKVKKFELIVTAILVIAFLLISSVAVFADNTEEEISILESLKNNNTANSSVPANNSNSNKNTSEKVVPDTGLADLPWIAIGVVALSAVFAYKKIKEYNID